MISKKKHTAQNQEIFSIFLFWVCTKHQYFVSFINNPDSIL